MIRKVKISLSKLDKNDRSLVLGKNKKTVMSEKTEEDLARENKLIKVKSLWRKLNAINKNCQKIRDLSDNEEILHQIHNIEIITEQSNNIILELMKLIEG